MRSITILLISLLLWERGYTRIIYVSTAGSDASGGTTSGTAWATIAKVNASAISGDTILFKRGEQWNGTITPGDNNIVYGSYGTGEKPVISGFTILTGWVNVGGNIWECNAATLKNSINILTINDTAIAIGRSPNTGFYSYSSSTSTSLTSASIVADWTGANVVMKVKAYRAQMARITSTSGTTINFVNTPTIDPNGSGLALESGTAGYGFILVNSLATLDSDKEWFLDTVTHKMKIYSTVNPTLRTIKATYIDTIINLAGRQNITVNGFTVIGANRYGIFSYLGNNVIIKNCDFNHNTIGVCGWNTDNITVDSSDINNSFNCAIRVTNNQRINFAIRNNNIKNTGQLFTQGIKASDFNLKAIVGTTGIVTTGTYNYITNNTCKKTGHAGIQFQGSNLTVSFNIVDTFCNILDDNGGIYTFTQNDTTGGKLRAYYSNRYVFNNFILNSIGAGDGAGGNIDAAGLYFDDWSRSIQAYNNTIANVPGIGIQLNNPTNINIRNNTVFNCSNAIAIGKKYFSNVDSNIVHGNYFFGSTDTTQLNYFHVNSNLTQPTPGMTITQSLTNMADIDSNYLGIYRVRPIGYYYSANGISYTFPPYLTLAEWRATYGHDIHSTTTTLPVRFEYNLSNSTKNITFTGLSYRTTNGTVYNNNYTIPAYGSVILLPNGSAPVDNSYIILYNTIFY